MTLPMSEIVIWLVDPAAISGTGCGIPEDEFRRDHGRMPHGAFVFRSGSTGENGQHSQLIEYSLKLDSNPEFTSAVLLAYARAAFRLAEKSDFGAKTVFDIPPAFISPLGGDQLREKYL